MSQKTFASAVDSSAFDDVRCTAPRYSFVAVAEITETTTERYVKGRAAEISCKECYIDTPHRFAGEALLNLCISRDRGTFAHRL